MGTATAEKAPTKSEIEAQIVKLQAKNTASTDSKERVGLRRQIRNLQKSIGTFVPRDQRTKASKTKTAVAKASKPAAKPAAKKPAAKKPAKK